MHSCNARLLEQLLFQSWAVMSSADPTYDQSFLGNLHCQPSDFSILSLPRDLGIRTGGWAVSSDVALRGLLDWLN